MDEFDYIVVGGGLSGCVVASRLTEDAGTSVLLIESGRRDEDRWIHIPGTFIKVIEKAEDVVFYMGEPSKATKERPVVVPQGHVIGGGSSVNGMVYICGQPQGYNQWVQLGVRGWAYKDVLPVFRALEGNRRLRDNYHGSDGPLHVSDKADGHPLSEAFIAAAQNVGIPRNDDFNGARQEGVGYFQVTTSNGRRWSAAQAFLREAEQRPNLKVLTQRRVARVTFEGHRASGVVLEDGEALGCRREVALCAGTLATPRLLQLSGIGNAGKLTAFGIDVVHDLPGVGENYQDHLESTVQAETKAPISMYGQNKGLAAARHWLQYRLTRKGLLTSNVVEAGAFVDVSDTGLPDLQFHFLPFMVGWVDRPAVEAHGFTIGPACLKPKSRGSVKLRSVDPKDPVLFDAGSLTDSADVEVLVRGVKKGIEILNAPSLAKLVKRRVLPEPGLEKDVEALRDYVRGTAKTVFHPVGTCKMGADSDRMAVLDNQLRVRGLEGLRVCDASAMPTITSGNTNAPTMMIAERATRFMRGLGTP